MAPNKQRTAKPEGEFLIKIAVHCIIEKKIYATSFSDALGLAEKEIDGRLIADGWEVLDSSDSVAGIDSTENWELP